MPSYIQLIAQRQSIARVCGPFLCTQNHMMTAIAAHRDELKNLLEDLSSDRMTSGISFITLVDAYISRLDTNCTDIGARFNPPPAPIDRGHMGPTLTQNSALY
jgi:hypothetical protein